MPSTALYWLAPHGWLRDADAGVTIPVSSPLSAAAMKKPRADRQRGASLSLNASPGFCEQLGYDRRSLPGHGPPSCPGGPRVPASERPKLASIVPSQPGGPVIAPIRHDAHLRPPQLVQTKRRRSAIEGKGA